MHPVLGIDLGTTDLKAAVFDVDGELLGLGRCTNEYLAGPVGWAEHDPRTWWSGCCRAIRQATAQSGLQPEAIAGIGVCGFHHCPVFLGAGGEPARATVVYDGGDSHCALVGLGVVGSREAGLLVGTNSTLTASAQRSRPICNRKMWPTRPCFCSRAGRPGSPAPS